VGRRSTRRCSPGKSPSTYDELPRRGGSRQAAARRGAELHERANKPDYASGER
jgi:hypothetical protein